MFIANARVLPKFNQTIKEFPHIITLSPLLPLLATLPIISHQDPVSSDSCNTRNRRGLSSTRVMIAFTLG